DLIYCILFFFTLLRPPPVFSLFPYTTLFRSIAIYGSDPGGSAAINFNGGSYDVGGTFRSTVDGDGTITFANTDVHADIIKVGVRSEEHTSELQSLRHLVCRLLLEKKK